MNSKKLLLLSVVGISLAAQLNASRDYHDYNGGLDDEAAYRKAVNDSMQFQQPTVKKNSTPSYTPSGNKVSNQSNLSMQNIINLQQNALNGQSYNGSNLANDEKQAMQLGKFLSNTNSHLVNVVANKNSYTPRSPVTISGNGFFPQNEKVFKGPTSTAFGSNTHFTTPKAIMPSANIVKENNIAPGTALMSQRSLLTAANRSENSLNNFNNAVQKNYTSYQIDKMNNDALKMGMFASLLPSTSPRATTVSSNFVNPSVSTVRTTPSMISQKSNVSPSSVYSTMKTLTTPSFNNPVNQFNAIMNTGSVSRLTNYSVPTLAPKATNNFSGISYQSNIRPSLFAVNNQFGKANRFSLSNPFLLGSKATIGGSSISYKSNISPSLFARNKQFANDNRFSVSHPFSFTSAKRVNEFTSVGKTGAIQPTYLKATEHRINNPRIVNRNGITAEQLKGLNMRTGGIKGMIPTTPLSLVPKL